jgi:hypothetical protein
LLLVIGRDVLEPILPRRGPTEEPPPPPPRMILRRIGLGMAMTGSSSSSESKLNMPLAKDSMLGEVRSSPFRLLSLVLR